MMSDFSSGILISEKHRETARLHMEDNTYLIKLNDAWLCRLSKNDCCRMAVENYSDAVLDMSASIPLLHIINAEDYEFKLCILHKKQVIFHFHVDYMIWEEIVFQVVHQRYGGDFGAAVRDDKFREAIDQEKHRQRHKFDETINNFFSGITEDTVSQFILLGFDRATCEKIQDILTIDSYKKDNVGRQMVEELLSVLGLLEFTLISHKHVNQNEGFFDIVEQQKSS